MTVHELQEKILKLKKETNTAILAHSYQAREIVEIADYTGDSYKLSVDASKTEADNILFCGVHTALLLGELAERGDDLPPPELQHQG